MKLKLSISIFILGLVIVYPLYSAPAEEAPKTTASLTPSDETTLLPPEAQVDYHNKRGKIFYEAQEYLKAIDEFEQCLNIDPHNSFAAKYLILSNQAQVKQDIEQKLKRKQKGEKLEAAQISPPAPVPEEKIAPKSPEPKVELNEQRPIEYIISDGDTLDISVWEWPTLKSEVIVRPDGKISFPLIGDVPASGLTLTQLDQVITERLSEFIRSPEVLVVFKNAGGKKIIVLGEVLTPGAYKVTGRKYTVMEAIALAGGYTDDAVLRSVIVIRGGTKNPKPISLNLAKTLKKADLTQDITLESEDIVYVPKTVIANVNYFVSQFTAPINQSIYTKKQIREWWKR